VKEIQYTVCSRNEVDIYASIHYFGVMMTHILTIRSYLRFLVSGTTGFFEEASLRMCVCGFNWAFDKQWANELAREYK